MSGAPGADGFSTRDASETGPYGQTSDAGSCVGCRRDGATFAGDFPCAAP